MNSQAKKWTTILVIITIYVVGFIVSPDYGRCWDEPAEMDILMSNVAEYVFNIFPEDAETYKNFRDSGIIPISESIQMDHGEATYLLIAPFIYLCQDQKMKSDIWHYYSYTIFFIGAMALLYILINVINNKYIAGLLTVSYYITPRFFAQSHFNNKDTILLSWLIVLCALFISLSKHFSYALPVLGGFVSALLVNSKILGGFFVVVLAVMYVFLSVNNRIDNKDIIKTLLIGFLSTVLFYILITPAMWHDPIVFFDYVLNSAKDFTRWKGYVRFRGNNYFHEGYPLPKYYLPYMFLITTPVYILVYLVMGHLLVALDIIQRGAEKETIKRRIVAISMTTIWFPPMLYAIISGMTVYNDWRHFYFIYGPLIIVAACGMDRIVSNHKAEKGIIILLLICDSYFVITGFINHPYQYCYYNFMAGKEVESQFELDYWNVSMEDGISYILSDDERDIIRITATEECAKRGIEDALEMVSQTDRIELLYNIRDDWYKADYIIANTTYDYIYGNEYPVELDDYELYKVFKAYGNGFLKIYKKNEN